jgi:arginyl-tRNA--protein-N-Asp/Glu arginylyltransferase
MKYWHSEFNQNYATYTFGYGAYASIEAGDDLSEAYGGGYLPYSGSPDIKDTLYMARSARVALQDFSPSSENRRILRKFDERFIKRQIEASAWRESDELLSFALSYFSKRHGASVMPRERLLHILCHDARPSGVAYYEGEKLTALVLSVEGPSFSHFWYSFYDLSLVEQSLGMWLMLDAARDAKERGKAHFYVGTVYGDKALYKTNFPALSWWDGRAWQEDVELLKARARSDAERTAQGADLWKASQALF